MESKKLKICNNMTKRLQRCGRFFDGGEKLYFEKEELRRAKQMSAIEFLKRYRPEELVRCGTGEYELRSHDSFKISESTSLWHWKSRDIGGKSALDYLVRVEDVPFTDAVRYLLEQDAPAYVPCRKIEEHRPFVLPPAAREEYRVELYLQSRGISLDVIRYCISRGRLYESLPYRSCVFVGLDPFAGAGTTILAAVQEGYEAVGVEVTDAYYRLGGDRVRTALAAGDERTAEASTREQGIQLDAQKR